MPMDEPTMAPWLDWAWWLYGFSPRVMDDLRKWAPPAWAPLRDGRLPISRLWGPTHVTGRTGTMIVAGAEPWASELAEYFFDGEPRRELIAHATCLSMSRTLKRLRDAADITVARVDRISARLLYGPEYLRIPDHVRLHVVLSDDPADLARMRRDTIEDLRRVRGQPFSWDISHSQADFREFYDRFHIPTMLNRHGRQQVVYNRHLAQRLFRSGGLLWVLYDGKRIAGTVYGRRGRQMELGGMGLEGGRQEYLKCGAFSAVYVFLTRYARECDCRCVDLGGTPALLRNGVFQYKRKWGELVPGVPYSPYGVRIYWPRFDELMAEFFERAAVVFHDPEGGFSGLTAVRSDRPAPVAKARRLHNRLWTRGLNRLYVVSPQGWSTPLEPPGIPVGHAGGPWGSKGGTPTLVLLEDLKAVRLSRGEYPP